MRFAPFPLLAVLAVFCFACSDPESRAGDWTTELPSVRRPAEIGARAWAAVPVASPRAGAEETAAVRFGVFTVAEPAADRASAGAAASLTLVDALGVAHEAPAALVHEDADGSVLEAGALALGLHRTAGVVLGRVASLSPPTLAFDWNGVAVREPVDGMRGIRGEVAPLEPVVFRDDSGWSRGIVLALAEERAWIADELGRVFTRPLGEVRAPSGLGDERAPGDAVLAYSWAGGFVAGTVEFSLDASRYLVRLESGETRSFAREDLVDAGLTGFQVESRNDGI